MATNTYIELDRVTVSTATPNVTFSNISQNYTNLVLVTNAKTAANTSIAVRVGNGSIDTGSNYSVTVMEGNGSLARSGRDSNANFGFITGLYAQVVAGNDITVLTYFQNYSNTTTFKNWLSRGNVPSQWTDASVTLWRSTSAINTIQILNNTGANIAAGSTFSLYGIRAAGVSPTPKATGGTIWEDDTYYYHSFAASGTFTPTQNLTNVDYLVIAGGGGGQNKIGGGGGAGGYRTTVGVSGGGSSPESKISLTSGTAYTCTIGAGGNASNGSDSSISGSGLTTITSIGGGRGGLGGQVSSPTPLGSSGGSGGGGGANEQSSATWAGGAGTAGQGYAGGDGKTGGASPLGWHMGAGGGGAGEAGPAITATSTRGGNGLTSSIDGVTRAGGGGGGTQYGDATFGTGGAGGGGRGGGYGLAPTNGVAFTGSGGGGGGYAGGGEVSSIGGSGTIIIRYAKA